MPNSPTGLINERARPKNLQVHALNQQIIQLQLEISDLKKRRVAPLTPPPVEPSEEALLLRIQLGAMLRDCYETDVELTHCKFKDGRRAQFLVDLEGSYQVMAQTLGLPWPNQHPPL